MNLIVLHMLIVDKCFVIYDSTNHFIESYKIISMQLC